jgi:hypothetical protein
MKRMFIPSCDMRAIILSYCVRRVPVQDSALNKWSQCRVGMCSSISTVDRHARPHRAFTSAVKASPASIDAGIALIFTLAFRDAAGLVIPAAPEVPPAAATESEELPPSSPSRLALVVCWPPLLSWCAGGLSRQCHRLRPRRVDPA